MAILIIFMTQFPKVVCKNGVYIIKAG